MTYEELKAAYEAAVQKCSELEKENDELKKSNEDQALHIEHLEEQILKRNKMLIDGAVVVSADTPDRAEIIERFTKREIPCLVNCMIFTEGTDMPLIETVIIARPTRNASLYTHMVGRGLRLHPDKTDLQLIDCVGITGKLNICTAPDLFGIGKLPTLRSLFCVVQCFLRRIIPLRSSRNAMTLTAITTGSGSFLR